MKRLLTIFALVFTLFSCSEKDVDIRDYYVGNYSVTGTLAITLAQQTQTANYTSNLKVLHGSTEITILLQDEDSRYEAEISSDETFAGAYTTSFDIGGKPVQFNVLSSGSFKNNVITVTQVYVSQDGKIKIISQGSGNKK